MIMRKVIIIDDEPDICFVLELELKMQGFDVRTFSSGLDCLKAVETFQPDIFLCDFQMPKMNGLQLFQSLRAQNFQQPFFVLTGEPSMDVGEILKMGISGILFKPQDLSKISKILTEACAKKDSGQ